LGTMYMMMMIAFITIKSSLVPLIEGLCACEEIKRGTHACTASRRGPVERWWTQDGKLGITIQDPPQSPEDGHIYCILLIRITFCHVSENLPLRCLFLRYYEYLFLFSMLKLHVTSSRFCSYLPNIDHFTYTFSHAHTEAHTHKPTCTFSTQEEWRQPGTGAWLRGAEERLCQRPCTHTHTQKTQKKNVRKNRYSRISRKDSST